MKIFSKTLAYKILKYYTNRILLILLYLNRMKYLPRKLKRDRKIEMLQHTGQRGVKNFELTRAFRDFLFSEKNFPVVLQRLSGDSKNSFPAPQRISPSFKGLSNRRY